jgi:anthranilate phosphoribosyltransferase
MNDIIGPITNPIHPRLMRKRVLGINHLIDPLVVAEAYQILNEKNITALDQGLFIRGFIDSKRQGGIDEVSIFKGGTSVVEIKNNSIYSYELKAEDFGISIQPYYEPPKGKYKKAQFSKEILEGKINGMPRDLILANSSILYYLDRGLDFEEGFKRAKEVLYSKEPLNLLIRYAKLSRGGLK